MPLSTLSMAGRECSILVILGRPRRIATRHVTNSDHRGVTAGAIINLLPMRKPYELRLKRLARALRITIAVGTSHTDSWLQLARDPETEVALRMLRHQCTNYDDVRRELRARCTVEYVEQIKDLVNARLTGLCRGYSMERGRDESWGGWRPVGLQASPSRGMGHGASRPVMYAPPGTASPAPPKAKGPVRPRIPKRVKRDRRRS
jgi:hypothetical protein